MTGATITSREAKRETREEVPETGSIQEFGEIKSSPFFSRVN